jgi:hypothetical protein
MRAALSLILLTAATLGAGDVRAPQVGYFGDRDGKLRPVFGLGGNFIVGDPAAHGVRSAAFSGGFGLIHASNELFLVNSALEILSRAAMPASGALLAVSADGRSAAAYLTETEELCHFAPPRAWELSCHPLRSEGVVHSIGVASGLFTSLAIQRSEDLWLVLVNPVTGRTVRETLLPGVSPPVLLLAGEDLLYSRDGEIVVRHAGAAETRLPLPVRVERFEAMGEGWIHLRAAGGHSSWAVRVNGDTVELHRLPGGGQ